MRRKLAWVLCGALLVVGCSKGAREDPRGGAMKAADEAVKRRETAKPGAAEKAEEPEAGDSGATEEERARALAMDIDEGRGEMPPELGAPREEPAGGRAPKPRALGPVPEAPTLPSDVPAQAVGGHDDWGPAPDRPSQPSYEVESLLKPTRVECSKRWGCRLDGGITDEVMSAIEQGDLARRTLTLTKGGDAELASLGRIAEQVVHLELRGMSATSLAIVAFLPNLRTLSVREMPEVKDLTPLAHAKGLKRVRFEGACVPLQFLAWLDGLSEVSLDVGRGCAEALGALAGKEGLKTLELRSGATDLGVIATLPKLERLTLSVPADDLSPIAQTWGTLKELTLDDVPATDLMPLAALRHLKSLSIFRARTADFKALFALKSLRSLAIRLPQADRIEHNGIQMGKHDLEFLRAMPELRTLRLWGSYVYDWRPLSTCRRLEVLELPEDNLADLEALKPLRHLRELSLRRATLKSLRPLAALHELTSLTLEGAQVPSLGPVSKITGLKRLFLGTPNAFDQSGLETLRRRRPNLKIY